VIAEIFHDESISEDLKAELYWIALRHYNNGTSKIFDKEKVESNHLESVLSSSTPSPTLLTSTQQKRRRYRQRESPPPPLASTTKSKRRRQRWELAAKNSTRKPISWEAYWWRQCAVYMYTIVLHNVYIIVLLMWWTLLCILSEFDISRITDDSDVLTLGCKLTSFTINICCFITKSHHSSTRAPFRRCVRLRSSTDESETHGVHYGQIWRTGRVLDCHLRRWRRSLRRIFRSAWTCTHQCIRTLHDRTLSRLDLQS